MAAPDPRPGAQGAIDAERLYLEHRDLLERIIRFVCRRGRLTADDTEEFSSRVHLRLVESNYDMLRRFEGRSSLQTYLTIVIQRLLLDYRVEKWGRFRPSAAAKAAGPAGVLLERLMVRDEQSFEDAIARVAAELRQPIDQHRLRALSARFTPRVRRQFEGEEVLDTIATDSPDVEHMLVDAERTQELTRLCENVTRLLASLPQQDRLVLQLRFEQGLSVADVARTLRIEQKPLYRRVERLLANLRQQLCGENAGSGPSTRDKDHERWRAR